MDDKVTIDEFFNPNNNDLGDSVIQIDDESEPLNKEVPGNKNFIEVDAVGQVDEMDKAFISEEVTSSLNVSEVEIPLVFSDDEIELSSDEEETPTDVSLVCLKRPVPVETTVECLEILDSDEEFPVCLVESWFSVVKSIFLKYFLRCKKRPCQH